MIPFRRVPSHNLFARCDHCGVRLTRGYAWGLDGHSFKACTKKHAKAELELICRLKS